MRKILLLIPLALLAGCGSFTRQEIDNRYARCMKGLIADKGLARAMLDGTCERRRDQEYIRAFGTASPSQLPEAIYYADPFN